MKKWFVVVVAVAVVSVLFPFVVSADGKQAVDCELSLMLVDAGQLDVQGNVVRTTGEKLEGNLDCAPSADGIDVSGTFTTNHDSKISFDPLGNFEGRLKGTFDIDPYDDDMAPFSGKIKAKISGTVEQVVGTPFGTFEIHRVIDIGKWNVKSDDTKGRGEFTVDLSGVVGVDPGDQPLHSVLEAFGTGALEGTGTLDGNIKVDNKDDRGKGRDRKNN